MKSLLMKVRTGALRLFWGSTQRRSTTMGALLGLLAATFVPNFGLATAGQGIPGLWLAYLVLLVMGALAGNRVGIWLEQRAALKK
jgi:hypothetical protein